MLYPSGRKTWQRGCILQPWGRHVAVLTLHLWCWALSQSSKSSLTAWVFSWAHRNTEGRPWWPLCASCMLFPNLLGLQPRTSMLGEKRQTFVRRCIHRAAIVEWSSDQNDNVDDCLPTVVSCSCSAHPAPLQWVLVSKQPDHKSVMFLTDQAHQSGQTEKCDMDSELKIKNVWWQWAHVITQPLPLLL